MQSKNPELPEESAAGPASPAPDRLAAASDVDSPAKPAVEPAASGAAPESDDTEPRPGSKPLGEPASAVERNTTAAADPDHVETPSAGSAAQSPFMRPANSVTGHNSDGASTPKPSVLDASNSGAPPASSPTATEPGIPWSATSTSRPTQPASAPPSPVSRPPQPATAAPSQANPAQAKEPEPSQSDAPKKGLLDLYDSEEIVSDVDSGDDGRFVLTTRRLIYQGRSAEGALFSAATVEDVTAIEFGRRPRDSRSAWWGVVGLLASIAVWQVTTNETVGAVSGAIVAGISLLLLADYWFRPAGLVLKFGTPGGTVEGPVSSKRIRDAEELAARVQQMKQASNAGGQNSPGRPPGGSPGID